MTGNIRRAMATVAAGAVITTGLAACGSAPLDAAQPRSGTTTASTPTPPAPTAGVTTTPTRTATPTPSPTTTTTASASAKSSPTRTAAPRPKRSSTPTATPTPKPSPTQTATPRPKPSPTQTAAPTPSPTPTVAPRDDIRVGDHGPKVLALQNRLSELGYWLGEPDGDFGFLTQQAVWAVQKTAGLSRDGNVGPATQRALADGVRPATQLSGNGVDIDLSRQILMIVRDGRVAHILNTSTGGGYQYKQKDGDTATARTPKGAFKVYYTVDGKDEGFLGDMWRPRYFNGGYAVHGSPSIPPYPASHGCARVSNAAMDMIWARDYLPKGATVLVR